MPRSRTTRIRRAATAVWLSLLTAAWLTTFGIGAGADELDGGDEVAPIDALGPFLVVPRTNAVFGEAGSTTQVGAAVVPADYVGSSCTLRVTGSNQWSVHPGNDLLISSGGVTIVVPDFEGQPDLSLSASGTFDAMGDMVSVAVRFGDDGMSSGGVTVTLDQCTVPGPPIPEPTTTSTTVSETTASTVPSTTVPSTTVPSTTVPSTTVPSSEPEPAGPTTVSTTAPTTVAAPTVPSTSTPTTDQAPAGPTTSVESATPPDDVSTTAPATVLVVAPPTSAPVEVLGIQQLPETGASETMALSGVTLVTLGWLLVSWSRRLELVAVEAAQPERTVG